MTKVEALKAVYTAMGGELTDTYENIADGLPVNSYVVVSNVIEAISEITSPPSKGETIKVITTTNEGNTITFVDETQQSIYQAVSNGEIVIVKASATIPSSGTRMGNYICSTYNGSEASFICVDRSYDMQTAINEFTVLANSTTNFVTRKYYVTEDYKSGGPT